MDDLGMSYLIRGYDAKLLKRLNDELKFLDLFKRHDLPEPTPEELRRMRIQNAWYERRVNRVKKVMAAYHISASALCDCDY